jgi:hypothetical protein
LFLETPRTRQPFARTRFGLYKKKKKAWRKRIKLVFFFLFLWLKMVEKMQGLTRASGASKSNKDA